MSKNKKPALRLEWIEAGSLTDNPDNWRRHSADHVATIKALIDDPEIGWAGACLFNEKTGRLIDGHARKSVVNDTTPIPVLVGNWSESAERRILLSLDPVGQLAAADSENLEKLLSQVRKNDVPESLLRMLQEQIDQVRESGEQVRSLGTQPPPKTTWVLIGIETVRFGAINELVERIATIPGVIMETTANDANTKDGQSQPAK